uniref:MADS-box domain-containing protein n=1 Tax=Fagus sylvatica TaxID=28930 RepID=A0A2N9GVL4_FAGSY
MSKSQAQSTQTKILRNRSTDFIEDEKSRRKAFMKRITTLKKKAEELSTLCDVEVCMVCFGLDGKFHVFPEEPEKAKAIIMKQKECSSKGISGKKKLNLAGLSRKDLKPKSVTLDEKTKLQKGKAKQVCEGENFGQNMENKLGLGLEENFGPMGENYCLQLKNNTPQEVMGFGMAENFGMMQQNNHLLPMIPQQQSPFMKFCQENHLQSKMNHNS